MMQTQELLDILCNDRLSRNAPPIDTSSMATVVVLFAATVFLLDIRDLTRLSELFQETRFQYLMCCLLVIYIAAALTILKSGKPGQFIRFTVAGCVVAWVTGVALMWLPMVPMFRPLFSSFAFHAVPLAFWLTASGKLLLFTLPWLVLFLLHLRHMAPTRSAWSGAAAGLAASALTATLALLGSKDPNISLHIYSHTAGMAMAALAGAIVARHFVRW